MSSNSLLDRTQIPIQETWQREAVFASTADWQEEFDSLTPELKQLKSYSNKLASNSETLVEWLELTQQLERRIHKLFFYAQMEASCDSLNQEAALLVSKASALSSQFVAETAFAVPEILAIPYEKINEWLKHHQSFSIYRHHIDNIFKLKNHQRSAEVEELFGLLGDPFYNSNKTRHIILNQELDFGEVQDSFGKSHVLAQSTIDSLISNPDRILRKNTWERYADKHLCFQETLANVYLTSVKQNIFLARSRGYKSVLEYKLAPFQISTQVFHNLVNTCKKHLPIWHNYWKVLRKVLKQENVAPYDIWAPLTSNTVQIDYSTAIELIAQGMMPLGKEYSELLKNGCLVNRWVDYSINKGKSPGAFSYGTYDTDPYIMMSFGNDIGSLSTLAHELGHSMHSYYTNKHQPYVYSGYSMFVAEVASNFNQALVRNYLFSKDSNRDFQLELIREAMDNIHRYFFIMPTLAQFEFEVYSRSENGEALDASELNRIMSNLYQAGYGNTLQDDPKRTGITWAQFGHLYDPFYTFQYATGISAAHSFVKKILSNEPKAVDNYLGFLKAGSSDYPINVLKQAGVDMNSTQATVDTFQVLEKLIQRLADLSS